MASLKAASSLAVVGRLHPGDVLGQLSGSMVGKAHTFLWSLTGGHKRIRLQLQKQHTQEATAAC